MKDKIPILLFVIVFLLSCVTLIPEATETMKTPTNTPDLSAEEFAIYAALLHLGEGQGMRVIQDRTDTAFISGEHSITYIQEQLPQVDPETIADLQAKNQESYALQDLFPPEVEGVVFISREEVDAFFEDGGWDAFYEKYPQANGIIEVSRVGFNSAGDEALVYVGNQHDYLAGAGFLVWMEKVDRQWVEKERIMLWIS